MPHPVTSEPLHDETRPRRLSKGVVITLIATGAGLALLVTAGVLFFARGFFDPQWNLTIAHVVENAPSQRGVSNAVDVTEDVCPDVGCVEAYDTTEALYVRFAGRDDAARYTAASADAFQSNYIVMDFSAKPDAEPERQERAMGYLVSTWQDFEGTLPTRD